MSNEEGIELSNERTNLFRVPNLVTGGIGAKEDTFTFEAKANTFLEWIGVTPKPQK